MEPDGIERKLTTILCADAAGYSRLMGRDEEETLARLKAYRAVIYDLVSGHRGRVFGSAGDSVIAEFVSPVEAVRCAAAIQEALDKRNTDVSEDRRMHFRIGINLGDVIVEGNNLFGDGVNIAARLEGLAEPGGICVSGDVYRHVRGRLAVGFEDLGEQEMKNIIEPVRVYRVDMAPGRPETSLAAWTDAMFDRLAVAVLPFTNLSGDPGQEYFSDGLTEDIITALAAWRSFPVIARNSSFIYKGRVVHARQVARDLGVRYVLEGSVRRGGDRLRITAQLVDATTGHQVWAERFDRDLQDVFALQDEITQHIVASMEIELERAEQRRAATKKPQNLSAWDYHLRGLSHLYEVTPEGNARARAMFERAIALDPTYSQAYVGLANSHNRDLLLECSADRNASIARLFEAARQAVALDGLSAAAHEAMSTACIWANQHDLAIAEVERAVQLDPNSAAARRALGNKLDLAGRSEEGIPQLERALQLSPQDPQIHVPMTFLARAHLNARRYDESATWARKAIQWRPDYPHAHYVLAIALGYLDRHADARAAIAECERLHPGFVERRADWKPYRNPVDNEHLHDGLRRTLQLE
jgi:adenylate cyclase